MKFNLVVSVEPYYFNCTECGRELTVRGSVELTDKLRKRGICDNCLHEFHAKLANREPVIFKQEPWANARMN
jgi:transcription elongation factor Elf1